MSTRSPDRAKATIAAGSAGFTLLETMLVGAMMSVAALVVGLNLQTDAPHKLELAAAEVAQSLRFARNEARRTATVHGVLIETDDRRLSLMRNEAAAIPPVPVFDVYHPISKQLYNIDLAQTLADADVLLSSTATWTGTCDAPELLYFDTLGRPRCGDDDWGSLLDQATLTISWAGHSRLVTVDGETGRVATP